MEQRKLFRGTVHQILAELCPFENFSKHLAVYNCLELIVSKFYFIIGIIFENN